MFDILNRIERNQQLTIALLRFIIRKVTTMAGELDALEANVAKETNLVNAIKTAMDGLVASNASLQQQLNDAIAAGDPARIKAASDAIAANNDKMAAMVPSLATAAVANTPAAAAPST